MSTTAQPPLLEMRDVEKSFPGVKAVRHGKLTLHAGRVTALLGENGAGKSTLIKMLGGAHRPDAGEIRINGELVNIRSPSDAQRLGIAVIYQELDLVPTMSARANIFLGREPRVAGFVRETRERREVDELLRRLNVYVDPEALVSELTIAQQQIVAIAKVLSGDARVVIMDEPSAPLTPSEVKTLFAIIRDLQKRGIAIVYISHRLDEIFEIADEVVVMRDGAHVASKPIGDVTRSGLIELMVGRPLDQEFPKDRSIGIGEDFLVVKGLSRGTKVRDVSFSVRCGEIVGMTGLVGAGRTEVVRLIFGADRKDAGTISVNGRVVDIRGPRDAIASGICLLPEDRKSQGLVLSSGCRENFGLPNLDRFATASFVRERSERMSFGKFVDSIRIKIAHQDVVARTLSGGNQQKLVIAKWLEADSDVVIFDEPTRGIDVGAKFEIYLLMNALARSGKAVLMISSELPEVLGMSDRILVMREGRLAATFDSVVGVTQEQVLACAVH
jgi:ABC-type sugar transport system ATPase subunit